MKMAKASAEEWQKVMNFVTELQDQIACEVSDAMLGKWVRINHTWCGRVVYGFKILVDNVCDPSNDILEFKPEIAAAISEYNKKPFVHIAPAILSADDWRTEAPVTLPAWFWSFNGSTWGIGTSFNTLPSQWTHWMPRVDDQVPNPPKPVGDFSPRLGVSALSLPARDTET